jgi:predicted nucleotidyltransferase
MSEPIDVPALAHALDAEPHILFALLFGSTRNGVRPKDDSDIDVAIYLDHKPDFDEHARLLGLVQDVVKSDRVDLVFLNVTENLFLQREALKGRLLTCRDRNAYAGFFSLVDRRARDEEDRIKRAWALRRELTGKAVERAMNQHGDP